MSPREKTLLEVATAKLVPTEHEEQAMFFQRLDASPWKHYPIYAVPNFFGAYGSEISRLRTGRRAKAEGRRKGVPDIIVDCPRMGIGDIQYHGLRLEMKRRKGGAVDPEQRQWLFNLAREGYATAVCRGHDAAWQALSTYLRGFWTPDDQWTPAMGLTRWG